MATLGSLGCQRAAEIQWVPSKRTLELPAPLQAKVAEQLTKFCGTPAQPKLIGRPEDPYDVHLLHGVSVYQARCAGCHGDSGDGDGPAAAHMVPRPRDYRRGIFKFTSTPYGAKPLRADLIRTIRHGARGTSMPAFAFMSEEDMQAVVDYVLVLTHRGELEELLALEAADEDDIDPTGVPGHVHSILKQWSAAADQRVEPLTRPVKYTAESIEKGKQAFMSETAGCHKCHGPDGRGRTTDNEKGFTDVWGIQTRAADLTSGMFHGGFEPVDIYRRIYSGINGTPMPGFATKLANEPDTFWHLVNYVQYVSSARRRDVVAAQQRYRSQATTAPSKGEQP